MAKKLKRPMLECCARCEKHVLARSGRRRLPKEWSRVGKRAFCGLCGNPRVFRDLQRQLEMVSKLAGDRPVAAFFLDGVTCMAQGRGSESRRWWSGGEPGLRVHQISSLMQSLVQYGETGDGERLKDDLLCAVAALER